MAGSNPSATPADRDGQTFSWRGPGAGRPDLPVPPVRQALLHKGQMRKKWRYVGFYGDEVMICAGIATVGPARHTFWSVWDRNGPDASGSVFEHTRLRPGGGEVTMNGDEIGIDTPTVKARLSLGEVEPIEVFSPSGRAWAWTRKRAGLPISGQVEVEGRHYELNGFGVDDQSAGYHQRHTAWKWSAGVGIATDGRSLGWNLVEGINDSPTRSERAIWVDGKPHEPDRVSFDGLDGVSFAGDGDDLRFDFGGAERSRHDNFGLIRSDYVHRFGTFGGDLDGIPIASATGVMEDHDVSW